MTGVLIGRRNLGYRDKEGGGHVTEAETEVMQLQAKEHRSTEDCGSPQKLRRGRDESSPSVFRGTPADTLTLTSDFQPPAP